MVSTEARIFAHAAADGSAKSSGTAAMMSCKAWLIGMGLLLLGRVVKHNRPASIVVYTEGSCGALNCLTLSARFSGFTFMVNIGQSNTLVVLEVGAHGVILDGGVSGRLLLPLTQCPEGVAPGDEVEAFVFLDGQGDPVPTTRRPAAEVGQVGWLPIVTVNDLGAFADWGVSKDLFIPFAEQQHPLVEGRHALVKVYLDNQGRPAGSTRIDHWIKDEPEGLAQGDRVSLIVADKTELGFKAIINHAFWGLLYSNELYQRVRKGEQLEGFVKRLRDDGKVDLTLNQPGFSKDKISSVSAAIVAALASVDGFLPLTDKSPPKEIYAAFQVSKKVFKQAVGALYKQRRIALEPTGIRLLDSDAGPAR